MLKESSNPLMYIALCILILVLFPGPPRFSGANASSDKNLPRTLVAPPWKHTFGMHRVRQIHLDMYSGYRKHFSSPQGIVAVKHVFNDKAGPGDDDELTVYGVNSGAAEIIYNTSRFSLAFFNRWEAGEGNFLRPIGIAADSEGWVAVADCGHNRVVYLRNEANDINYIRSVTLAETGIPLAFPSGVTIESGKLYIADSGNNRIAVANRDGELIETIGENSKQWRLYNPFDVAVITSPDWNFYSSKFIIVTDSLNQRLTKLSMDGVPLAVRRSYEISGDRSGFFFVAIDYYSNVYTTDTNGQCVYKFDRNLNYLTRFGCFSEAEDNLDEPRGITIYRRFGQVFVAERAGASYYWIGTDIMALSCESRIEGESIAFEVHFNLTEHSYITVQLESEKKTLHVFDENLFMPPGRITRNYDGNEVKLPCPVAKCKYFITVIAKPTYSSKRFLTVTKRAQVRMR